MMETSPKLSFKDKKKRRSSRLHAVQALYQIFLINTSPHTVIQEFIERRLNKQEGLLAADVHYFTQRVTSTIKNKEIIDDIIKSQLPLDWPFERIELLILCILRAAIDEILSQSDVPFPVIIDEYVTIAHAFYDSKEASFVNSFVDKIGKTLRN